MIEATLSAFVSSALTIDTPCKECKKKIRPWSCYGVDCELIDTENTCFDCFLPNVNHMSREKEIMLAGTMYHFYDDKIASNHYLYAY